MEPTDSLSEESRKERKALQFATEYLHLERLKMEAQNAEIESLIVRQEQLKTRLHEFLTEAQAERKAIEQERARILTPGGMGG